MLERVVPALLLAMTLAYIAVDVVMGPQRVAMDVAAIRHVEGYLYAWRLPRIGPLMAWGDDNHAVRRSRLVLFEDDVPLGPAHAQHEYLRTDGRGAYSHWNKTLLFTSADNTDPRSNGRRYAVEIDYRFPPGTQGVLVLAWLTWLALRFLPLRNRADWTLAWRRARIVLGLPPGDDRAVVELTSRHRERLALCVAFAWPFLFFHRYLLPESSYALSIGNDFLLYYVYKVYLLDALASLHLPLWSPAEAAGFPFFSSPIAQPFYPGNLLFLASRVLLGGFSVIDYQWTVIAHVGLLGLGLYLWARESGVDRRPALLASMVFSVCFKVADILRFPNALFAAAWIPWVLYGVCLCLRPGRARRGGLVLLGAVACLGTAGYPYYVVYLPFLVVPYVLALCLPATRDALTGPRLDACAAPRFLALTTAAGAAGALLAGVWLHFAQQLVTVTTNRGGAGYDFSTRAGFTPTDTVGSVLYPPAAQSEGWLHFGYLPFLILVVYLASAVVDRRRHAREGRFALVVLAWTAFITAITWGRQSYLFDLLWHTLPVFPSLRLWGRLNILLVPVLCLAFARAWMYWESTRCEAGAATPLARPAKVFLVLAGVLTIAVPLLLHGAGVRDEYWIYYAVGQLAPAWWYPAMAIVGVGAVAGLARVRGRGLPAPRRNLVAVAVLVVTVVNVWPESATQWGTPYPLRYRGRTAVDVPAVLADGLRAPRTNLYGAIYPENLPRFNAGLVSSWYLQSYVDFYLGFFDHSGQRLPDRDERDVAAAARVLGITAGEHFFATRSVEHAGPREMLADADAVAAAGALRYSVRHYDGDLLEVDVDAREPLYFWFIDNWTADWVARIDGVEATIERGFGTFKVVRLGPGAALVAFSYEPLRRRAVP